MAKELDAQTKVCKSVKRDGGYARKISHKFVIGIPDLLVALPSFAPCVVEMKDLGRCVDKFDRKLGVTAKQALEMQRISEPYEKYDNLKTACVMVAIFHRGEHRLVVVPRDVDQLDHSYECDRQRWTSRQPGGYYDLQPLLNWAGIARI